MKPTVYLGVSCNEVIIDGWFEEKAEDPGTQQTVDPSENLKKKNNRN